MIVIMTMNGHQEPVGFRRIKLDELSEFKPPDPSANEYPQYIENRKFRKYAMHLLRNEDVWKAGETKVVDGRCWNRDFERWSNDRSQPRPGPHPFKDHPWNTMQEIFDYPSSDDEDGNTGIY